MDNLEPQGPIVVGVDGSAPSIEALRRAAAISSALGVPIKAVTVWQFPATVTLYYFPATDWSPDDDARKTLRTAIDQAFAGAPPANLDTAVIEGSPARVLIRESKHANMLILGSRGHGGFTGLLLGSVSAACAEHAHCPVLIVHGPGNAERQPRSGTRAEQEEASMTHTGSASG